jgi:hypothetical protein
MRKTTTSEIEKCRRSESSRFDHGEEKKRKKKKKKKNVSMEQKTKNKKNKNKKKGIDRAALHQRI